MYVSELCQCHNVQMYVWQVCLINWISWNVACFTMFKHMTKCSKVCQNVQKCGGGMEKNRVQVAKYINHQCKLHQELIKNSSHFQS